MKVQDVMTREMVTVGAETPLIEVARLLDEHRISGIPVVDDGGTCIGVVSEADLLAKQLNRPLGSRAPLEWIFGDRQDPEERRRRAATTAADAMSAPPVTITADRPLREAAALMVDRDVNRLPVVEGSTLVGIVTRADLVRAYLRMDEEIGRVVRENVLRGTMWLDPGDFLIEIHDGHVRIGGLVDRRSTAGIIERLIGVADGVVRVDSSIRWALDDSGIEPGGEMEGEPGAASLTARDVKQSLHR